MRKLFVLSAILLFNLAAQTYAQNITVDSVYPLISSGVIPTGKVITLAVRFNNDFATTIVAGETHFIIYSPTSATWTQSLIDTTDNVVPWWYNGGPELIYRSNDGSGVDTITFRGLNLDNTGMPPGFNEVAFRVKIGPIPNNFHNGTICMDSINFIPFGDWLWIDDTGAVYPTWGGPYCYTIQDYNQVCCIGMRGNVNDDPMGTVNVIDLIYLIAYVLRGGPTPPCLAEIDVNGSGGGQGIVDIVYLVRYLFQGGPAPVMCP
jgi:hypothetical protein